MNLLISFYSFPGQLKCQKIKGFNSISYLPFNISFVWRWVAWKRCICNMFLRLTLIYLFTCSCFSERAKAEAEARRSQSLWAAGEALLAATRRQQTETKVVNELKALEKAGWSHSCRILNLNETNLFSSRWNGRLSMKRVTKIGETRDVCKDRENPNLNFLTSYYSSRNDIGFGTMSFYLFDKVHKLIPIVITKCFIKNYK